MKFTIENIGRIRSAEIAVKPLTVFIGKANTNKTWSAYSLYGILRSISVNRRGGLGPVASCSGIDSAIEQIVNHAAEFLVRAVANQKALADSLTPAKDTSSISYLIHRDEILDRAYFDAGATFSLDNEGIASILSVDPGSLRDARATLHIPYLQFIESSKIHSLNFEWTSEYLMVSAVSENGIPMYRHFGGSVAEKLDVKLMEERIRPHVRWLAGSLFNDVMAFPAERKGLSSLVPLISDGPMRETKLASCMNIPCMDYVGLLSAFQRGFAPRLRHGGPLNRVVDLIESRVMNGRAEYQGEAEQRMFNYVSQDGPSVQLHASASFIRSLAGLDLYLRTSMTQDVIVIDEPEMNAHPEAQIQLVEIFAMLANLGLQIVITTHSPYFVDHLNNLLEANQLRGESRDAIVKKLKMQDPLALISPDRVSAYLFKEDGSVSSLINDGVVDLDSFSSETDYLGNLYSSILSS